MAIDLLYPNWLYKDMKWPITGGIVQIDEVDLYLIKAYKWHVSDRGYAVWRGVRGGIKKTIRMHRIIAKTPKGMITDHINHDKLDNRRSNLRICTQSDNMRNKRDQGKGYWFQRQNLNWVVEVNGIHRGTFTTEKEAKDFVALVRAGLAYKKPKIQPLNCIYGHSIADAYIYNGKKNCKQCQSQRSKKYYRRKHAN